MKTELIYNYYNNSYYILSPSLDIKLIIITEIFIKEFKISNIIFNTRGNSNKIGYQNIINNEAKINYRNKKIEEEKLK